MTPGAINRAIAEWCAVTAPTKPDYYHSLDAVHEAWLNLTDDQHIQFVHNLASILSLGMWGHRGNDTRTITAFLRATAPQRCEALLRTLGLWKGDKP